MNTESNKAPSSRTSVRKALRQAPLRLLGMLYHNWAWKLLALFLAVCLWAGLITQNPTLTRERVFNDVQLSVTGADSLRRNSGLIVVSGLENENLNVRLRVDVPQRAYNTVTAANYNPRIDLTRIAEPGEQVLKIASTSGTAYGSVRAVMPDTLTVMVDEYVTNYRIPISVVAAGEVPGGFWGGSISLDPSVVAVSGPKSVVDQLSRIYVDYSLKDLPARAGKVRTARPMRFVDAMGKEMDSSLLEVSSAGVVLRTIILEQTLYPTRMIPLSTADLTLGDPAPGYRVKKVTVSPSVLRAAGTAEALDAVERIFIDAPISLKEQAESFTEVVRITKPAELAYLSADTITVAVELEPITVSRVFEDVKVLARGISNGLYAKLSQKKLSIALTGEQIALQTLKTAQLTAYVDVTGLEEGNYELPVQLHIDGVQADTFTYIATPASVSVVLAQE